VIQSHLKHIKVSAEQRQEVFEEEIIKRLKDVQKYCKKLSDTVKKVVARVELVQEDLHEV